MTKYFKTRKAAYAWAMSLMNRGFDISLGSCEGSSKFFVSWS